MNSGLQAVDNQKQKDDDMVKLDRLQLINASARFELLSANQQLLDFHLNRIVNQKKYKTKVSSNTNPRAISEAVGNESDRDDRPHFHSTQENEATFPQHH
jgi:predicted ATPase